MIQKLEKTSLIEASKKCKRRFDEFNHLIDAINTKEIPEEVQHSISNIIKDLEKEGKTIKAYSKGIRKSQHKIVKMLEKQLKIVPKNYYRNLWMAIGMSALGVPMGVAFGAALQNMAFIGVGIPIGMAIGIGIGTGMDSKAEKEGRQLDIQIEV